MLKLMAKGNRKAFSKAYELYFNPLCHYAYRFFLDQDEAYEIVQHTFLKIWEKQKNLENIASLKSYLFRAVHNSCLNRAEHLKVANKYCTKERLKLKEIELDSVEDDLYSTEVRKKLAAAIQELPDKNRKVLELRYFYNMRYKEIADKLHISERTVETHLRKSILEIKKTFKNIHNK